MSPISHLALLALLSSTALASPTPLAPSPRDDDAPTPPMIRIGLHPNTRQYSDDLAVRQEWLKNQGRQARRKYAQHLGERGQALRRRDVAEQQIARREAERKRSTGSVSLTDVGDDASYSGQVAVGTPSQDFLVILDTGSADLWIADSQCESSGCTGTTLFTTSSSSTFSSTGQSFDITYGSGEAAGTLATDTVTMGGFTVTGQTFAVVNETTASLISNPLSGLMGLAWKSIAQSGATPFWQTLAASGSWDSAEMAFYLKRYRGDDSASQVESDGGEFTMGGLDSSKYTGDMNYITIDSDDQDYWRIPLQGLTVQGSSVTTDTSSSTAGCAIDTGTTLIGVPSSAAQSIYAQISGSEAMSDSSGYEGYYQYPCSTSVNVTFQFGGKNYAMSNADMNLGSFTRDTSMCTGAFFDMDFGSTSPIQWIVGASFLKNVYSSFRYNPSAVGFAALSGSADSVTNSSSSSSSSTTGGGTAGTGGQGNSSSGSGSGSGSSSSGSSSAAGQVPHVGVLAAVLLATGAVASALL